MVTYDNYIKDILNQILESHDLLTKLHDKPGDLEIINREWLKINGLLNSLIIRIDSSKMNRDLYQEIKKLSKFYLDNYYFEREIQTMSSLYSEDSDRLKNLRLKILDSYNDRKFIDRIKGIIKDL